MPETNECRVLYVEDDTQSREVLKFILANVLKIDESHFFEDSHDFMDRMKALPGVPDVIFLDLQVRPLTGYQMLAQLRDDPVYNNTKIVAMTANVMSDEIARMQEAGFDGLVGKPIMYKNFPQLFQNILDGEPVWYIS